MKFRIIVSTASLVFLIHAIGAPNLKAGIIPTSQDRFISIDGHLSIVGQPSETFAESRSAPDFGLFDEDLFEQISDPIEGPVVNARAYQKSLISSTLITAVGGTSALALVFGKSHGQGSSTFELEFDITHTEIWRLEALLEDDGPPEAPGAAGNSLILQGPGQDVGFHEPVLVNQLIKLTPGSYRLFIVSGAFGGDVEFGPGGSANYDVTFQAIPEPGSAFLLAAGAVALGLARRGRYRSRQSFSA